MLGASTLFTGTGFRVGLSQASTERYHPANPAFWLRPEWEGVETIAEKHQLEVTSRHRCIEEDLFQREGEERCAKI
jgi:hypothetical protein